MKREIRNHMAALRRSVPPAERASYSRRICECLTARFNAPATIAVYLATDEEISLDGFIASAPCGIRLAAPRWDSETRTYQLAELAALNQLSPGRLGIREPSCHAPAVAPDEIDVWLVPGLAFTKSGKRLGYGGGYYDRFLASASPSSKSIGIAYPFQLLDDLPSEPHDIAMNEVLALYSCSK